MNAFSNPICDSAVARQNLLSEIDRLSDVAQDLEERLQQVTIPASNGSDACSSMAPEPPRSALADELYNRAARIAAVADRLINLRNSIDL